MTPEQITAVSALLTIAIVGLLCVVLAGAEDGDRHWY